MYGDYSKKPTSIYSNKCIDLMMCNHRGPHKINIETHVSNYANRSVVPTKLIIDILNKLDVL
jgi:hypothetical protein